MRDKYVVIYESALAVNNPRISAIIVEAKDKEQAVRSAESRGFVRVALAVAPASPGGQALRPVSPPDEGRVQERKTMTRLEI